MNKIVDKLLSLAEQGDERAENLFLDMENMGPEQLASYVAENDSILQDVLGLNKSIMDEDLAEEDKALMDEYYSVRNTGVTNFVKPTGSARADVYGRPMHTLDEYMQAFGVAPEDNLAISDDDRAYFTNPEHPNYWKNRPENERRTVANKMGFQDLRELDEYLDRAAQDFQGRNRAEGWDANNKIDIPTFAASTIGGFVFPRVKEAKLDGRDIAARDFAGDIAENALSLVPGMGTTKILSKVPKVGGKIAGSTAGQLAGTAFDQVAQPLVSQGIDAGILYNPSVLGKPGDELNLRSDFSLPTVAAQGGAIAGVKGLAKQAAGVAKNFAETRYGKTAGGQAVKNWLTPIENINEKTDDLIARRQAVLDRKAELAKQRRNVGFATDNDIPAGNANVADMQAAETFRILDSEAERLAKSEEARKAYRDAIAKDRAWKSSAEKIEDAYAPLEKIGKILPENFVVDESKYAVMPLGDNYKLAIPAWTDPDVINGAINEVRRRLDKFKRFSNTPEGQQAAAAVAAREGAVPEHAQVILDYVNANEASPIKGQLLELPDGNLVNSNWVTRRGDEWRVSYPGADYEVKLNGKPAPLAYQYEKTFDPGMDVNEIYGRKPVEGELSRNKAVREKILQDDILKRKLDHKATFRREAKRDIAFNDLFNAMAREGVGGLSQATGIEEKRERALWNSMVGKLRELTTDTRMPIDKRRKYADAIMNVMQYGLDGLPAELYGADPETYREIAGKLGVTDWKHYTETNPQPTPSSSRTK